MNRLNLNFKAGVLTFTALFFATFLVIAAVDGHISLASLPTWEPAEWVAPAEEAAPAVDSGELSQDQPVVVDMEMEAVLFTRFIMDNNRKIFPTLALHIAESIVAVSEEYQIPPVYLLALAYVESTFRYDAVSKADCVGLLQINPAVWLNNSGNKADLSIAGIALTVNDLYDPETNLRAGAHIFSHYFTQAKKSQNSAPLKYALTKYLGGDKNNHYAKFEAAVGKFYVYKESQEG